MEQTLYIGPYIEAKFELKKEQFSSGSGICTSIDCINKYKKLTGKYCPNCGKELDPILEEQTITPDVYELIGDSPLMQVFCFITDFYPQGDDTHFIILNQTSILDRDTDDSVSWDLRDCCEGVVDFSNIDMDEEINILKTKCKKQLKILEKNYKEVHIKWGIIVWAS